jgi:hypothetical protein
MQHSLCICTHMCIITHTSHCCCSRKCSLHTALHITCSWHILTTANVMPVFMLSLVWTCTVQLLTKNMYVNLTWNLLRYVKLQNLKFIIFPRYHLSIIVKNSASLQILGTKSPRQLHFVQWHLTTFVGSQYGPCCNVTLLAPAALLRWYLDFLKICAPLSHEVYQATLAVTLCWEQKNVMRMWAMWQQAQERLMYWRCVDHDSLTDWYKCEGKTN